MCILCRFIHVTMFITNSTRLDSCNRRLLNAKNTSSRTGERSGDEERKGKAAVLCRARESFSILMFVLAFLVFLLVNFCYSRERSARPNRPWMRRRCASPPTTTAHHISHVLNVLEHCHRKIEVVETVHHVFLPQPPVFRVQNDHKASSCRVSWAMLHYCQNTITLVFLVQDGCSDCRG